MTNDVLVEYLVLRKTNLASATSLLVYKCRYGTTAAVVSTVLKFHGSCNTSSDSKKIIFRSKMYILSFDQVHSIHQCNGKMTYSVFSIILN